MFIFSFSRNWIWQKFQVFLFLEQKFQLDGTPCHGLTAAPEFHTPTEPIRISTGRTPPRASMPRCPKRRRFAGLPRRTRRAERGSRRSRVSGPVRSMSPQAARQRALVDCNGGEVRGLCCRPATTFGDGQIAMFLYFAVERVALCDFVTASYKLSLHRFSTRRLEILLGSL